MGVLGAGSSDEPGPWGGYVVPVPAGRVHLNLATRAPTRTWELAGGARLAGWCSPSSPMVFAVAAAVVAEAFAGLARSWSTCCGPAAVLVVGLLSSGGLCWLPAAGLG